MEIKHEDYRSEERIISKGFAYEHSVKTTHTPTGISITITGERSTPRGRAKGIEALQPLLPDAYMTLLCKQIRELELPITDNTESVQFIGNILARKERA